MEESIEKTGNQKELPYFYKILCSDLYSDSSFHVDSVELSTILKTIFEVFLAIEAMNIQICFL